MGQWNEEEAFGGNAPNQDPNGTGQNFVFNLRFPGQYFDRETNLFYNGYRYYDPQTGRYNRVDPLGLFGGSMSPYIYVNSDPLSFIDPFGLAGAIPKSYGKNKPMGPLPNTIKDAREKSDQIADLPTGIQGLLCAIGIGCVQDETLVCLKVECIMGNCHKKFVMDYRDPGPSLIPSDKMWPPSPGQVPKGCKCTLVALTCPEIFGPERI